MGVGAHSNERRAAAKASRVRNIEGAVRRGRGEKEEEWTDCIQSDRTFGIAGDKATALEAEVWVETVTEGGRGLMIACRK